MKPFVLQLRSCILALLIVWLGSSGIVQAQFYFGKNKVQYTEFDWQVMSTDHFRIYFYTDESEIARMAGRLAEDSYRALAIKFNHEIKRKVPLIVYSSPSYFTQTNVIPGLLPESVAGFTEFMKGRVVLPFHGSVHDFDHVLRHELVHVFTLSKLEAVLNRHSRVRYRLPPLWFTEGLAEFWSKDWDAEADMIVRDMVISGRLYSIPNLYAIRGSFFMYKLGESICRFIEQDYGPDKLLLLLENWYKGRSFDEIVRLTLGDNLAELSRKWEYSLKKEHFPRLEKLDLPTMESRRLTHEGFSVKGVPIRWDDGTGISDWVVYKANRRGYSGLYMTPLHSKGKPKVRTLLKGERSAKFESLYLLRSGIDANDSGLVLFASKYKDRDVLYVYDLNAGEVTRRYEFDDLVAARSPRFSSDGRKVVFSGVQISGHADLYLLDFASGEYQALTDDIYFDTDPVFSNDGTSIVFSSDRSAEGRSGALNLYRLDIENRSIEQLTYGVFRDRNPECSPSGIYFASDRISGFNLFLRDADGRITRQSSWATGAFDPRLSRDGEYLVYTGYQDMQFQVFKMKPDPGVDDLSTQPLSAAGPWTPKGITGEYKRSSVRYSTDYSFDIAQSSVGYDPVYGSIGGIQAAMSDILGNRLFYFLLTNTARTKDEFLESFNVGITYVNKEKRLNWGVGVYHLYNEYFNDHDGIYFERQAGALSLLSYPVSKFSRIDLTTLARYSKRDRVLFFDEREKVLATHYVSWVYDDALWDITGPMEGRRYNITVGYTWTVGEFNSFNRLAAVDLRHYLRLGRRSAFANRLFAYSSAGEEPQRIYFGGSWSFRGFDRREWYRRNVLFASNELRFPLIDRLLIGLPIGGLGFSGIQGALFYDSGAAWDEEFDQFLGSFGAGFRVALGYVMVLRFDFSRTTDYRTISPSTDFDFFFGWNF